MRESPITGFIILKTGHCTKQFKYKIININNERKNIYFFFIFFFKLKNVLGVIYPFNTNTNNSTCTINNNFLKSVGIEFSVV